MRRNSSGKIIQYPEDLKKKVIDLLMSGKYQVRHISKETGISERTLYLWRDEVQHPTDKENISRMEAFRKSFIPSKIATDICNMDITEELAQYVDHIISVLTQEIKDTPLKNDQMKLLGNKAIIITIKKLIVDYLNNKDEQRRNELKASIDSLCSKLVAGEEGR